MKRAKLRRLPAAGIERSASAGPGRRRLAVRLARLPVDEALLGAHLVYRLPQLLRQPIGRNQARLVLGRRLERRATDFLALARRAIYGYALSPYRKLLGLAGCELGDLERLVLGEGVEGALRELLRWGVYLTADEFAGRRVVVRGSAVVALNPAACCNPWSGFRLTGGGSDRPAVIPFDLASLRDHAVNLRLFLDARSDRPWRHGLWGPPGGASLSGLIEYRLAGLRPERWFSPLDPAGPELDPRYRWSATALRLIGLLAGATFPRAIRTPPTRPRPITDWLTWVAQDGDTPHLIVPTSGAVRLAQQALREGLDLGGAQLTVVVEPYTAARRAMVEQAGATAVPDYGSVEAGGAIGYGCLAPSAPDEVHLCHDLHALIQAGPELDAGLATDSLLLSSLRPTAPFILLNVAIGDRATAVQRACGCPLERLGWSTQLRNIERRGKLVAEGLAIQAAELESVLGRVLPSRFGGRANDYQAVPNIADDGRSVVRLLVHPRLGPLDHTAVAGAVLAALEQEGGPSRVAALLWREAATLRVERLALREGA